MFSKVATYTGITLLKLVSHLPFPVLYAISDILFYLVYHLIRYRRKVADMNLFNSFPEKDAAEREKIAKDFYRYLCDIIVEIIKSRTITAEEISRRMVIRNPELVNNFYKQGKSVIVMALHYGNWEWLFHMPLQIRHHHYAVHKPLQNRIFDRYQNAIRERFGAESVSMSITLRKLLAAEKQHKRVLTGLVADQAPPWNHPFWTTFLNQETMFFNGPAKIARRLNQPVLFQQIRRIRRGYYETWFEVLFENPGTESEETIINNYIKKAEMVIQNAPPYYLWSHRRWKYKKPVKEPAI